VQWRSALVLLNDRKVAAKAAFFVIYTFKIKKNRKKALRLRKKYYICAFLEETE